MALIAQLVKTAPSIRTIDDLFFWLASTMVERFDVQVVQFWANQLYHTGQIFTELRAMICQDSSLPQQTVTNMYVAEVVRGIINARDAPMLQKMEQVFHQYQAILLGRYGLHYCCSYFLSSDALLPPPDDHLSPERIPTPLTVVALLFLRQPLVFEVQKTIEYTLKQAVQFAESRALLLPPTPVSHMPGGYRLEPLQQRSSIVLDNLIPRRKEDAGLMSTSNPLTSISPIADKQARRLYAAIDGHRNMEQLRQIVHLTQGEIYKALQTLLREHRVEVFDTRGQPIASSQLFDER
jgi:hypothetical protein